MRKRYEIWRHYTLQGSFTFQEAKQWLLNHLEECYHSDIRNARHYKTLRDITSCSEYCSLNLIRPRAIPLRSEEYYGRKW